MAYYRFVNRLESYALDIKIEMRLDVVVVTSFFVSCSTQTIKPGCLPTVKGFADLWCPGDNNYTCYKVI